LRSTHNQSLINSDVNMSEIRCSQDSMFCKDVDYPFPEERKAVGIVYSDAELDDLEYCITLTE